MKDKIHDMEAVFSVRKDERRVKNTLATLQVQKQECALNSKRNHWLLAFQDHMCEQKRHWTSDKRDN